MQLFFTKKIEGKVAYLEATEAQHCQRVLRKQEGDILYCTDGKGDIYETHIIELNKKEGLLSIQKIMPTYNQRDFYLHIAIAPTKNIARLEWFLEKATEMGIDEITPLLCQRSERKMIRTDRLEKILITAMKQSLKGQLPKLNELTKFDNFIQKEPTDFSKYIAHCDYKSNIHLKEKYQKRKNVVILIGPEGDFTDSELKKAFDFGFEGIGLGKNRLRTETAGIIACHTINLMNEK